MTIPIPDNPQHVKNLESIALLKAQGFRGPDASLAESLFEYGLAWRDLGDEILFIYRHPSIPNRFDRCTMDKTTDVKKEYDWANWDGLFSFIGQTESEWSDYPLTLKIYDLFGYYGSEEIFGSSYWEGFAITDER